MKSELWSFEIKLDFVLSKVAVSHCGGSAFECKEWVPEAAVGQPK